MNCGAARKHLYTFNGLLSEQADFPAMAEVRQAQAHLMKCAACRKFFAEEEQIKSLIKKRAAREQASPRLREGALILIACERKRQQRKSLLSRFLAHRRASLAVAGLMALIFALAALWFYGLRAEAEPGQVISALVEDHTKLSGATHIASSDNLAVQSWFHDKVDFALRLPQLSDPQLIGARLCNLQGKRAALIFYQSDQNAISLFVFDGSEVELPKDRLIALDGKLCVIVSQKGFNVVLWKERGLLYGLVSEARNTDLLQVVEKF
ncbi:MAG: hypothetical protein AB1631_33630 [Acidobacteriota bacterium]